MTIKYHPQDGWLGTSNRYRRLGRLPEGMTALQALEKYNPEAHAIVMQRAEDWAKTEWLRVTPDRLKPENCIAELTPGQWQAFKMLGGKSA